MLDIFLQILSVLGILILVLLGLLLMIILLVLFFPVTYRADGKKTLEDMSVRVRVNWLFGLLRVRYAYPEPGKVTAKLLFFKLFETGKSTEEEKTGSGKSAEKKRAGKDQKVGKDTERSDKEDMAQNEERTGDPGASDKAEAAVEDVSNTSARSAPDQEKTDSKFGFFKKIEKIKYTITGTYDKIKQIWQNISYYAELLREEETRLLFSHAKLRLWKILKSIRPRKLRADVVFGTGSPDTTGYAFGVYAALSPTLGPHVAVTPDFERAVLQGEFEAAGHITAVVLLWHLLRVVLDKRLWRLLDKLKGNAQDKRGNGGKNGR